MPPSKKFKSSPNISNDINVMPKTSIDSDSDLGDDWREYCFGVCDINAYALRKGILTDITFIVGPQKEIFKAHRLILALGSAVFYAMFYGPLAEKGETVTIPDVDPEGFHYLLKFLYTENAVFKNESSTIKTAFAADKYCVSYLKDRCERFLCDIEVLPSNVWVFLQNSFYLNMASLKQRCFSYLHHNMESALQHKSFLEINATTIETVLNRNSLCIPERKLLESVIQWASHNSDPENKVSFKKAVMPLLKYISFRSLQPEEFVHYLEVKQLKEVLQPEDSLSILKHILLPNLCALPNWCIKTQRVITSRSLPSSVKSVSKRKMASSNTTSHKQLFTSSSSSSPVDSQNDSSSSTSSDSGSSSSSSEFSE